ncbi:hypothetical protein LguiB_010018 [Lonicera macranthoides]
MRVGSGWNINVWSDPWLDDVSSPLVETPPPSGLEELKVADLILPDTREWNISLLYSMFSFRDCEEILSIPVSRFTHEDRWRWKFEEKGIYLVKTGYKSLAANSWPVLGPAQIPWCSIWFLNVPGKISNFLWRLFSSSLPTRAALRARHRCGYALNSATSWPVIHLARRGGIRFEAGSVSQRWRALRCCCGVFGQTTTRKFGKA